MKIRPIGWTNLPLLVASVSLLVAAWFVPRDRDPSGQGDILLSMILVVKALAMPPSKIVTVIGCILTLIALAGNGGVLPVGRWRIAELIAVVPLCAVVLFWDRFGSPPRGGSPGKSIH